MFGWGRKAAMKQRAKLLARMIGLITHGLDKTIRTIRREFFESG
jgi:hypothetical protein